MRFILGVLVGYSMRGNEKRLITVLATIAFIVYIVLPAIMLLALISRIRRSSSLNCSSLAGSPARLSADCSPPASGAPATTRCGNARRRRGRFSIRSAAKHDVYARATRNANVSRPNSSLPSREPSSTSDRRWPLGARDG